MKDENETSLSNGPNGHDFLFVDDDKLTFEASYCIAEYMHLTTTLHQSNINKTY